MPATNVAVTGLVLVHGTTVAPSMWRPAMDALDEGFRIVAPALSGSGATTDPGGDLSVDDLVAQVLAAVDAAGVETCHLVGHSLGAVVATAVAARVPQRLNGLFVHAGWLAADRPTAFQFDLLARLLRADPELAGRYILLHTKTLSALESDDLEAFVNGNMPVSAVRQIEFNARVDISDRVAAITAPTLIVTGQHDQMVPMRLQQRLVEAIPHATQTILPTAHAMPFDQPDLFIELLTDFLADTERNR